jgi:hypothetical protein
MTERVIDVRGLRKTYGDLEAVRCIDLHVDRGEVFALLGPNGVGKTTTVEILEGFRDRSDGAVQVLGRDPARHEEALRRRIGIVLQSTGVDPYLTAFIPLGDDAPGWITTVSNIFPVRHFFDAMASSFLGNMTVRTPEGAVRALPFDWADLLIVAVWGLAGLLLAARFFSWEPRK